MSGAEQRYLQAIERARAAGDEEAARFLERELASATQQYSATEGMGAGEQLLANLGAGVHTTAQGVAQWFGGGPDDATLERTREDKARLAAQSDLDIAPEWAPTLGSATQVVGEALPMAVPVGGAAAGVAKLASRASRALPRALAKAGTRLATSPVATGAAAGAVGGAALPVTSTESRGLNAALGGAGGAVLPAGAAGVRAARDFGSPQRRAGKVLMRAVEKAGGAPEKVASRLERPQGSIPMTVGQRTGLSDVAALERQTGSAMAARGADFDRIQNEAVYNTLERQTRARTDYPALKAARTQATSASREAAMKSASRWKHVGEPLRREVETLMAQSVPDSPRRGLAALVGKTLDENPSPEKLYELRHMLAGKLGGPSHPNDQLAAIVKGARQETRALMAAIDDRLNEASDGLYDTYMKQFSAMSKPVDEAVALQAVWDKIDAPGQPLKGAVPHVTRHGLRQAMKETEGAFGERLQPTSQRQLGVTMRKLQQIEEPARTVRGAATPGGGSDTHSKLVAGMRGLGVNTARILPFVTSAQKNLRAAEQEALAELLYDPKKAATALRATLQAGEPISPAQQAFLAISSQAGAGALLGAQQ